MIKHFWYGILFSLLLISGVFIAGCSDQSPAGNTTPATTTAAYTAKYAAGDIIARTASSTDQMLYVIVSYDRALDQYTRQLIYKNSDGSWGHFVTNKTESVERTLVEKVYPFKVAQVKVNAIAIVTPTIPPTVTMTPSGNSPAITSISPTRGATNSTVNFIVTGNYFQSGATVKLMRAGAPPILGTGVTASSSNINGIFKLTGAEKGVYNVIVTNPDGQYGSLDRGFTVGESAPIITNVVPVTGIYNETVLLTITGQNFKIPAIVRLSQGSGNPKICQVTLTEATKISCNLEILSGPSGEWNVTVTNIADELSGTWNRPFKVNAT
jgi:hypothetical protein